MYCNHQVPSLTLGFQLRKVSDQMSERGKSDDPERPVNEDLHQLTLLQLIFEITPIGLAVVKGSDLFFHTANLAYRGYLPSVDIDPVDQRYEEVWPPRDGFEENVRIQKVIDLYSLQVELEHEQVTTILTPILAKINTATVSGYQITGRSLRAMASTVWPNQRNGRAAWEAG